MIFGTTFMSLLLLGATAEDQIEGTPPGLLPEDDLLRGAAEEARRRVTTKTIIDGGHSHCTASSPCPECHGDCDNDSQCQGSLKCFQRTATSQTVPGCAGTLVTTAADHDYCYNPARLLAATNNSGMWTAIFVSDMEANYRGHSTKTAARRVKYMKTLKNEPLYFDNGMKVIPQLLVHGGDINADHWCTEQNCWNGAKKRTPELEYEEIWGQLYSAGIPMISNWGNHDYNDEVKNDSNNKSRQFSNDSFVKSQRLNNGFTYTRYQGKGGVDVYKAEFKGLQIAMFQETPWIGNEFPWGLRQFKHNEENARAMVATLDKNKPTMFITHYPLSDKDMSADERNWMVNEISQFTKAAHFSGHKHTRAQRQYTWGSGGNSFIDYTAAYANVQDVDFPAKAKDYKNLIAENRKAGFYAVLIHPTNGIQEVKHFPMKEPGCLAKGRYCVDTLTGSTSGAPSCQDECCENKSNWEYWVDKGHNACGKEEWGKNHDCGADHWGGSCDKCINGSQCNNFWCRWSGVHWCK